MPSPGPQPWPAVKQKAADAKLWTLFATSCLSMLKEYGIAMDQQFTADWAAGLADKMLIHAKARGFSIPE